MASCPARGLGAGGGGDWAEPGERGSPQRDLARLTVGKMEGWH